jgi:hypothetical protein
MSSRSTYLIAAGCRSLGAAVAGDAGTVVVAELAIGAADCELISFVSFVSFARFLVRNKLRFHIAETHFSVDGRGCRISARGKKI